MVDGVYRMLEKLRSRESVYSIFQDPGMLLVDSVYSIRKKSGPGQILGRWRIQDARKAQIREACILNFSRLRQIPSRQRIQDTRKARIQTAPKVICILKNPEVRRFTA